MLLRFYQSKVT